MTSLQFGEELYALTKQKKHAYTTSKLEIEKWTCLPTAPELQWHPEKAFRAQRCQESACPRMSERVVQSVLMSAR
jgi:hypothetical protein